MQYNKKGRRFLAIFVLLEWWIFQMARTNYEGNRALNVRYGGAATYVKPATVYIGLFTAAPTVAGGGTEVAGGSYARVAVTNDATNWPDAVARAKSNAVALAFAQATGSWGTVTHVGIFDALTVGNLQDFATLVASKTVQNGDVVQFGIGSLAFSET